MRSLAFTAALALGAGTVAAMNGGSPVSDADVTTTGAVFLRIGDVSCSGTLMSPTWVLTARHCAIPNDPGFGGGVDHIAAPSTGFAGVAAAVHTINPVERYVAVGWSAPANAGGVKDRRAVVAGFRSDGYGADDDYGTDGFTTIDFAADTAAGASELYDVIRVPASAEVIAVGRVMIGSTNHMLIARFNSVGDLVATPWATTNPGATVAYEKMTGIASRVLDSGHGIVVAGTDVTDGSTRWLAVRYDATGHRDPSFFPFSTGDAGQLLDVVRVGPYLAWLGTNGDAAGTTRVVLTDLDGQRSGAPLTIEPSLRAQRLLGHGTDAVWIVGTNRTEDAVAAVRFMLPDLTQDLSWSDEVIAGPAPAGIVIGGAADDGGRLIVAGSWELEGERDTMLVRFDAAGGPDRTFGQTGVVVTSDKPQRVRAMIAEPDRGRLVVLGVDGSDVESMFIGAYRTDTNHPPAGKVTYGSATPVSIDKVVFHSDPAVDVAMVHVPALGGTVIAGIDHTPISGMIGAPVECYGYGDGPSGTTGKLRHGTFHVEQLDALHGSRIVIRGTAPDHLEHGDSGGACLIERDGVRSVMGVNHGGQDGFRAGAKGRKDSMEWFDAPAKFAAFVESTIATP